MAHCFVCHHPLESPVYVATGVTSITSLCQTIPGQITVSFCRQCGHLQTQPLLELKAYYENEYRILVATEEEDQLYAMEKGRTIFRTEHQVNTLLNHVKLPAGARVLDYGCAKSSTLKQLCQRRNDLQPYVFDVSEMYIPFWKTFIADDHWATFQPKPEWRGHFDLITSFFALEHVADPQVALRTIASLLKPGGSFYGIVPNVYTNTADFVVADHVNHFSAESLRHLLATTGFSLLNLDEIAHHGAFVIVARKNGATPTALAPSTAPKDLEEQVRIMANYWQGFSRRVHEFEAHHAAARSVAIYGSGFYGTFIATCLKNLEKVVCFLDQNPHRQAHTLLNKPIIAPAQLPPGVEVIYVGLNPLRARTEIESISSWRLKPHIYFYP